MEKTKNKHLEKQNLKECDWSIKKNQNKNYANCVVFCAYEHKDDEPNEKKKPSQNKPYITI